MKDLLKFTPLECKRNKANNAWSVAVVVKGQKKVGEQTIPTTDVQYLKSEVQLEANKEVTCEVKLYAINGDLIRIIQSVVK